LFHEVPEGESAYPGPLNVLEIGIDLVARSLQK
jgi:hypothetical protein